MEFLFADSEFKNSWMSVECSVIPLSLRREGTEERLTFFARKANKLSAALNVSSRGYPAEL